MREQTVRYVERVPLPKVSELKESYQVRPDKPVLWLQKLCCIVLNKLGARAETHTTDFTYRTIDTSNLVERIYTQLGMLDRDYNIRGRWVLMGAEDFAKLCEAAEAQYYLTVEASSYKFGGLTVTVIPWMRGILVMPEEK